jgi:hypothetical protein
MGDNKMKKMQRLVGYIVKIEGEMVIVASDQSGEEFYFHSGDFDEPQAGQKIDLLISLDSNSDGVSKVLMKKKKVASKAYKMTNFATLVKYMVKTRDRLQATIENMDEDAQTGDIKEKIDYLNRGIELFS